MSLLSLPTHTDTSLSRSVQRLEAREDSKRAPVIWRTEGEVWYLFHVPARSCLVSFTDSEGLRHSTEVQAETLYEAAVLATQAFKEQACAPGSASVLEVEIRRASVVHSVPMRKVRDWLDGACKSPNEKVIKERLKKLLES